jgi:hypothetical protein
MKDNKHIDLLIAGSPVPEPERGLVINGGTPDLVTPDGWADLKTEYLPYVASKEYTAEGTYQWQDKVEPGKKKVHHNKKVTSASTRKAHKKMQKRSRKNNR